MFSRIIIVTSFFLSLLISHQAEAGVAVWDGGHVIGIKDISISGINYEVDFQYGSYNSIYDSTGWTFDLSSENDAITAITLINEVLNNIELSSGQYYIPVHDGGTDRGSYNIPYSNLGPSATTRMGNVFGSTPETIHWGMWGEPINHGRTVVNMWARMTPVPIPGAILFLGSGLIGLVGFRKKFKK